MSEEASRPYVLDLDQMERLVDQLEFSEKRRATRLYPPFVYMLPADVRALIARVRELETLQEWQPIETAPRDGTEILVRHDPGDGHSIVRWSDQHGCWEDENWDGEVSRNVPPFDGWRPL